MSKRCRGIVTADGKAAEEEEEQAVLHDDDLGFCCHTCTCNISNMEFPEGDTLETVHTHFTCSDNAVWHRRCCHNEMTVSANLATLFLRTADACGDASGAIPPEEPLEWVTKKQLVDALRTAEGQQSALYNADGQAVELDRLRSNAAYRPTIEVPFNDLVNARRQQEHDDDADTKKKPSAVVLDCFAGVGTGVLVLKKLGIAISKVIHVEHDKVSTHVYRYNHDACYGSDDDDTNHNGDGIEHVYYADYNTLEAEPRDEFLARHGPIDIILGGPPCVDYSRVNANRQGVNGEQGQYMLRFGTFIRAIEQHQHPHPLFFMAENVVLRGDDLQKVTDAFGFDWDPINLDAQYLSPTRRNRHFFTNIPLTDLDYANNLGSKASPTVCLEEGYRVPAHIIDEEEKTVCKAQCFMASRSRIDEHATLRMFVFRNKPQKGENFKGKRYCGRPMTVEEREKMMGYPVGYVEKPVRQLFQILFEKGLATDDRPRGTNGFWQTTLPRKYHCFAGNYHALECHDPYRFQLLKEMDQHTQSLFRHTMAPPTTNACPEFFNAESYAKHLIGLAFSVPVVEFLLQPLVDLFQQRNYPKYSSHRYVWQEQQAAATAHQPAHP